MTGHLPRTAFTLIGAPGADLFWKLQVAALLSGRRIFQSKRSHLYEVSKLCDFPIPKKINKYNYGVQSWHRGLVVITAAQLHLTKPELRFCAGSNPARGVSEICLSSVNYNTKTIHHHHHQYQILQNYYLFSFFHSLYTCLLLLLLFILNLFSSWFSPSKY